MARSTAEAKEDDGYTGKFPLFAWAVDTIYDTTDSKWYEEGYTGTYRVPLDLVFSSFYPEIEEMFTMEQRMPAEGDGYYRGQYWVVARY